MDDPRFMIDSQGRHVPVDLVKPIDKLRDQTVWKVIDQVLQLRQSIVEFKQSVHADLVAFLELSANEHGKTWGGNKGNVTLVSFDGHYKVIIAMDDILTHDERLQIAKGILQDFVQRRRNELPDWALALIEDAYYVGKSGRFGTYRLLGLRRLKLDYSDWKQAMDLISESITVLETKQYLRFYRRNDRGKYDQIALDPAKV